MAVQHPIVSTDFAVLLIPAAAGGRKETPRRVFPAGCFWFRRLAEGSLIGAALFGELWHGFQRPVTH